MTSNHDPTIVTLLHNALEDIMDHFLIMGATLFGPLCLTPYYSKNPGYTLEIRTSEGIVGPSV